MSYFHDCEADGVVPNRLDYYFSEGFTPDGELLPMEDDEEEDDD